MMSQELELYLERKAICEVDGVPEEKAIEIAYEQVNPMLAHWMPDKIYKDLKRIGKL